MPANPPPASPRHARFTREEPFDKRDPPGLTRILPPQAGKFAFRRVQMLQDRTLVGGRRAYARPASECRRSARPVHGS